MDIDRGGIQRFMAQQRSDGKQVCPLFIKVSAKGMAESMAGETVFPAKLCFFCKNKLVYCIRCHRPVGVRSVGEKEPPGFSGPEPVLCEDVQGIPGKNGISVRTRFGMADMYAHGRPADILVA